MILLASGERKFDKCRGGRDGTTPPAAHRGSGVLPVVVPWTTRVRPVGNLLLRRLRLVMNNSSCSASNTHYFGSGLGYISVVVAIALCMTGCGPNRFEQRAPAWAGTLEPAAGRPVGSVTSDTPRSQPTTAAENDKVNDPSFYKPGTGVLIRPPGPVADARKESDGDVKLNFQSANLLEVIKVVLGDMLNLNYTVDPAVQGVVSMQTTRAMAHDDLIPTLELLLRMNNAALIVDDDLYRIVPLARALAEARSPQLGDSTIPLPPGFTVNVVPLKYVAAEEMAQILEPFIADGNQNQLLRVDSSRNLLILATAGARMDRLLDTIDVFDVDRMAGMSVALFTPDFVDAATLAEDLEKLLSDPEHGLMAGLVRFIVVERLNGLIVVTPRAEHLARVRSWIDRLDRNTGDASPRLFVYRVQNGKAVEMAETLSALFQDDTEDGTGKAELAPGLRKVTIGKSEKSRDRENAAESVSMKPTAEIVGQPDLEQGLRIDARARVQIIADEANNALLILAKGTEYRQILAALRQLDVSPMQVLIEVTIAEVTLTDKLSFGVEWFFKNNFGSKTGEGLLNLGTSSAIGPVVPGFSYALKGPDVRLVLNTLATESNLSVISSPTLLVLNNQEATINVGEEVPLITQQANSVVDPDSPLVSTVEYRDTGVLLKVKPRVNAGGLVIMEVDQEVSQATSTIDSDPLTPRIRQRKISSTVAVNSGDTIILGGLIEENRDRSESGIPILHKTPYLGALFGAKADSQDRTELIVLITPRAVTDSTAALQVTESFRRRLQKLIPQNSQKKKEPAPEGVGQ